jgi:hypothetical protein
MLEWLTDWNLALFLLLVCVCVVGVWFAHLSIRHCLFILQSTHCIPITSADIVSSENIILGLNYNVNFIYTVSLQNPFSEWNTVTEWLTGYLCKIFCKNNVTSLLRAVCLLRLVVTFLLLFAVVMSRHFHCVRIWRDHCGLRSAP